MVNRFPYSNFHDLNADWIIEKIQQIGELDALQPGLHDVKYYGAVGDGVTDDTDAIKDCISNENVVIFPAGSYLITGNITANNKSFCGLPFANLVFTNATLTIVNGSKILFTNLKISHSGGVKTVTEINASQSIISKCYFEKLLFKGNSNTIADCYFNASANYGLDLYNCNMVTVANCHAISNGDSGFAIRSSYNVNLINCESYGNGNHGYDVQSGNSLQLLAVTGSSNTGYGLNVTNCSFTLGLARWLSNTAGTVNSDTSYNAVSTSAVP